MKKVFVVLTALILFILGFAAGSKAVLRSPKWVEQEAGLYLIITEFFGNEYVDIAEKPGHMYNEFSFALGRR